MSLPGLRRTRRAGAPHPSLGPGRAHEALEPRAPVSPAPPRGPRRGLSGRAPAGWRACVQVAGRADHSSRAVPTRRADGSCCGDARAARTEWTGLASADGHTRLARRAVRSGLRDRRPEPAGAEAAGPAAGAAALVARARLGEHLDQYGAALARGLHLVGKRDAHTV